MGFDITLETSKLPKPDIKSNASNLSRAVDNELKSDGKNFGASVADTISQEIEQETDVPANVKRTTSMDKAAMKAPQTPPNHQPQENYKSNFNSMPKVGNPSTSFGESDDVTSGMETDDSEKDLTATWEKSKAKNKAVTESALETRGLFGKKSNSDDTQNIPTSSIPNLPRTLKLDIGKIFGACFWEDPSKYPSRIVDVNIEYGTHISRKIADIAIKMGTMSSDEIIGLFIINREYLSDDLRMMVESQDIPFQEECINNIVMMDMQFSMTKASIFSKQWKVSAVIPYGVLKDTNSQVLNDYTATIETGDLTGLVQTVETDKSIVEAAIAKSPNVVAALEAVADIYKVPPSHILADNSLRNIKVQEDFIIAPENTNVQGNKENIIRAIATLLDNIGCRIDKQLDDYQNSCIAQNKEIERQQMLSSQGRPSFDDTASKVYFNDQDDITADVKPQPFGDDSSEPQDVPEPKAFGDEDEDSSVMEYLYDLYGTPYIGSTMFSEMGYDVDKYSSSEFIQEAKTNGSSTINPEDIKYMRFDNSGIVKAIKCFNEMRKNQSDVKEDNLLDYKKIISDPKFKEGIDALSEQFDCNLRITLENTTDMIGYTMTDRYSNPRHKVTISKKSGFKLNGYRIYVTLSMGLFQFASPKEEDKFGQMLVSVLLHEIFHNITTLLMWDNAAWIGSYMATITRAIQTKSPKVKKVLIQKYIENMENVSGRKMNKIKKLTLQKQLFALCSAKQIQKAFDSAKSIKKKVETSTVSGGTESKSADASAEALIDNLNKVIPDLKDQYRTKPGKVAGAIISWCLTCIIGFAGSVAYVTGSITMGPVIFFSIIGLLHSSFKTLDAAFPAMLRKMAEQFKSGKDLEEQFADAFAAMYKLPVVFHFAPSEDFTQKYKYNELSTKNLDKLVSLFKEFSTLVMDVHPTDYERASQAIKAAKQILADGGKYIDPTQKKYLEWLVNGFDSIEDTSVDDVVQGESPVFDPEATADLNKHLENLIQHGRKNINITESFNFNDLMDKREKIISESERPTVAIIDGKAAVLDPDAEDKTWSNP